MSQANAPFEGQPGRGTAEPAGRRTSVYRLYAGIAAGTLIWRKQFREIVGESPPREWSALVTDEVDLRADADEPSMEDFEAAEQEELPTGPWVVLRRILRIVGVLLVIAALLVYFVVPYQNVFSAWRHWRLPSIPLHTIPLAPEPKSVPTLPA